MYFLKVTFLKDGQQENERQWTEVEVEGNCNKILGKNKNLQCGYGQAVKQFSQRSGKSSFPGDV